MATPKQEREIKKLMKRIKEAKDEDLGEAVIRSRTGDLMVYLEREGFVSRFDE